MEKYIDTFINYSILTEKKSLLSDLGSKTGLTPERVESNKRGEYRVYFKDQIEKNDVNKIQKYIKGNVNKFVTFGDYWLETEYDEDNIREPFIDFKIEI